MEGAVEGEEAAFLLAALGVLIHKLCRSRPEEAMALARMALR